MPVRVNPKRFAELGMPMPNGSVAFADDATMSKARDALTGIKCGQETMTKMAEILAGDPDFVASLTTDPASPPAPALDKFSERRPVARGMDSPAIRASLSQTENGRAMLRDYDRRRGRTGR